MFEEFETISEYSRAQAIDDGELVDVSETAREAGFKIPTAISRAVFDKYVTIPKGVRLQDEAGRLWDVLWMARWGANKNKNASQFLYQLHVRNNNREGTPPLRTLKCLIGPGDDGGPCITIMLPDED